jgi:dUTPase
MRLLPSQENPLLNLIRATPGSTGWDLSSTTYTVLTPDIGVQTLPTGFLGPLSPGTWGLLLGQSSSIMKGLQIFSGVIDNDYAGEIRIMAASPVAL